MQSSRSWQSFREIIRPSPSQARGTFLMYCCNKRCTQLNMSSGYCWHIGWIGGELSPTTTWHPWLPSWVIIKAEHPCSHRWVERTLGFFFKQAVVATFLKRPPPVMVVCTTINHCSHCSVEQGTPYPRLYPRQRGYPYPLQTWKRTTSADRLSSAPSWYWYWVPSFHLAKWDRVLAVMF